MPHRRKIRPRLTSPNGARHARRVANLRLQGIAAACAVLARDHGEPDDAAMVLHSLGLTVADLVTAGADPLDLESLRPRAVNP
jgi:hypothetical protein